MKRLLTLAAIATLAGGAAAQSVPGQTVPAAPRAGGLGGLLGGGLPNIGGVGLSNAAGLLGYCLQNNLLGGARTGGGAAGSANAVPATGARGTAATPSTAQSIFERLTGRQGVQSSPGFALGQSGQVQAGGAQASGQGRAQGRTAGFSLDSLGGQAKAQVCNLILNRAGSFP